MSVLASTLSDAHARLTALAEDMQDVRRPESRKELFAAFIAEYMPQAHAKNVVLYAALLKVSKCEWAHSCAHRGQIQQQLIQELLKYLQLNRFIGSELWTAQAAVLRELVFAYVTTERESLLPRLDECFDEVQLRDLCVRYQTMREKGGASLWGWPKTKWRRVERASEARKTA